MTTAFDSTPPAMSNGSAPSSAVPLSAVPLPAIHPNGSNGTHTAPATVPVTVPARISDTDEHPDKQAAAFLTRYAAEVSNTLQALPLAQIHAVVQTLTRAWLTGHRVYTMGNGGSAATASHLACDLAKNTAQPGLARLQVLSFNDNMAMVSALANDAAYDQIFAEQVRTYVQPMDVVIAISTSGNSPNVLTAIEAAKQRKAITLGLCGYQGGQLANMVHVPVIAPSHNVEQIEDIHMVMAHMITAAVREEMKASLRRRNGHD
jgi:D-sedoheptulose 7-phosphate isomerase